MKRCVVFLLCACSFFACRELRTYEGKELIMGVLKGPSAVSVVQMITDTVTIQNLPVKVRLYDAPDQLQAALIRSECDVAILPVTMAANLYNKGLPYAFLGCPIWGNLYWVASDNQLQSDTTISIFSRGTTPDIITRFLLEKKKQSRYKIDYRFATPFALAQALLTGETKNGILPEPYVSMLLSRDSTLYIREDMATSFARYTGGKEGFPQTAVVVSRVVAEDTALVNQLNKTLERVVEFTAHNDSAYTYIRQAGLVADSVSLPQMIDRCRFRYRPATFIKNNVDSLLQIIYLYEPKAVGGKKIDEAFYVIP